MKILHTADIHIGAKNSRLPALKQQILKEENILQLNSLFTKLHDEHYDMMIIAGDLFHSKNISQRLASSFFRKVEEIKIPVIYVLGNHDEKFIFNNVPENFIILNEDRPFYQFDNIKILSIYQNESESSPADNVNILVAHGDIYNSSSRDYLDLSRLTTNNNIDLVLLGHIHSYRKEDIGKTTTIYPGSLFSNGFDECGDKGYVEIEILNKSINSKFVPFAKHRYMSKECDITDKDDINAIVLAVQNCIQDCSKNDLVRVVLTGYFTEDSEKYISQINSSFNNYFYFEVKDNSKLKIDFDKIRNEKLSFKAEFLSLVEDSNENEDDKNKISLLGIEALKGENLSI